MAAIGIIANPASGKDIRRLVSYATTIDNNEKVNICQRIVLSAQAMGVEEIYFMPETFAIGYTVMDNLKNDRVLSARIRVLDFPMDASVKDTVRAAEIMEEMKLGCVLVLGGDGTSRAAASALKTTPMLPISTGTNNVYPRFMEGTVAGMTAAAVSRLPEPHSCCIRDKRIEVSVNGSYRDMALIDAVVSRDFFSGARAIWNPEKIRALVVSRCHPASIGFSSIAGVWRVVRDTDDFGIAAETGPEGERLLAPIAAGVLAEVGIRNTRRLELGAVYEFTADSRCMIALDGERELPVAPGDCVSIKLSRNGPWRVLPEKALETAQKMGMYRK